MANEIIFLISNFRRILYVVCFLLGNSPASEFYMPTDRYSVPKRWHIKFRRQGITQKKTYNMREFCFPTGALKRDRD